MTYTPKPDNRDTSNGMTPAKTISRSKPLPTVKPILGNYNKPMVNKPMKGGSKRGG